MKKNNNTEINKVTDSGKVFNFFICPERLG